MGIYAKLENLSFIQFNMVICNNVKENLQKYSKEAFNSSKLYSIKSYSVMINP
jgi:hypothetical protein